MHPNYCQITILLVLDLHSSLAYFLMTHPLPIAGKWVSRFGGLWNGGMEWWNGGMVI